MKKILLASLVLSSFILSANVMAEDETIISPTEEYVLVDQDGVKITFTGKYDDSSNCANPQLIVENSTDTNIDVSYNGTMNGWSIGTCGLGNGSNIKANTKAKAYLWFMFDDYDLTSSDDINTMNLTFIITDHDSYSDLFEASTGPLAFEGRESSSEAAQGKVLFDQDGIKAVMTGETDDSSNCANVIVIVENSSDKSIDVSYNGSMNGWNVGDCGMGNASGIKPGSKANGYLWFMFDDFDLTSSDDIETMNLTFTVKDHESYTTLFEAETGEIDFHNLDSDSIDASEPEVSNSEETSTIEEVSTAEPSSIEEDGANEATVETPNTATLTPDFVFHTDVSAASEGEAKYETLTVGSSGDAVVKLQEALIEKQLLEGAADGKFGNMTAGAVSAFQESAGIAATGTADSITQEILYGEYVEPEIDVSQALLEGTWLFNGGDDLILNGISFSDTNATLAQVYFDGNGKHENESQALPYVVNEDSITLTLVDGSTMDVPFEVKNGQLCLNKGEWVTVADVKAGLQGNWMDKGVAFGVNYEYHTTINGDLFTTEDANSNGFYFGPYEGQFELNFGGIDADFMHSGDWFYNIIGGEVKLLRYDNVFERTDIGLLGQGGYSF